MSFKFYFFVFLLSWVQTELFAQRPKNAHFCVLLDSIFADSLLRPRVFWKEKRFLETRILDIHKKTPWAACECFQKINPKMRFVKGLSLDINTGQSRDMLVTNYIFNTQKNILNIEIHHFIPASAGAQSYPHHYIYYISAKWLPKSKKWINLNIQEAIV